MSDYCTCCPTNAECVAQHYDPDRLTGPDESPEAVIEIFRGCCTDEPCPLTLADVRAYMEMLEQETRNFD